MAKANANGVSDRYAEPGTTVDRAIGDRVEVVTAARDEKILDLNVPGQTPAELRKTGTVEPPSEPVYLDLPKREADTDGKAVSGAEPRTASPEADGGDSPTTKAESATQRAGRPGTRAK